MGVPPFSGTPQMGFKPSNGPAQRCVRPQVQALHVHSLECYCGGPAGVSMATWVLPPMINMKYFPNETQGA